MLQSSTQYLISISLCLQYGLSLVGHAVVYQTIRIETYAFGPLEIVEVVVEPDGTRLHVKLGSSRGFAIYGVRGEPINNTGFDHDKNGSSTHPIGDAVCPPIGK